ncbi:MAG: hypothetical protein KC493_15160 [Bacteriovoracaceae bacterium]|nr:hypothetical protein [Bacteriovoracaceae bacterium]
MKMKRTLKFFAMCLVLSAGSACKKNIDDIPLIGIDGNGEVHEVSISGKKFKKFNTRAMKYTKEETLKALSSLDKGEKKSWKLDAVEVGLAAKAGFGLGNVLKAEAEPAFILVYKKRN